MRARARPCRARASRRSRAADGAGHARRADRGLVRLKMQVGDGLSVRPEQTAAHSRGRVAHAGQRVDRQRGRAVGGERGACGVVFEMRGWHGEERDVAINARERPAVVGVEFPTVAAGGHGDGEHVVGVGAQVVGDVKRGGIVAAGPRAERVTVQRGVVTEEHAVETQQHARAGPRGRHLEGAAIKPGAREEFLAVLRLGEALQLPMSRHRDRPEGRGFGAGEGTCAIREFPCAVQREGRSVALRRRNFKRLGPRDQRGQPKQDSKAEVTGHAQSQCIRAAETRQRAVSSVIALRVE